MEDAWSLSADEIDFGGIPEEEILPALYYEIARSNDRVKKAVCAIRNQYPQIAGKVESRADGILEVLAEDRDGMIRKLEVHSSIDGAFEKVAQYLESEGSILNPRLIGLLLLLHEYPTTPWKLIQDDYRKEVFSFFFLEGHTPNYPFDLSRAVQFFKVQGRKSDSVERWKKVAREEWLSERSILELHVDWSLPLSSITESFEEQIRILMPKEKAKLEDAKISKKLPRGSESYWSTLPLPMRISECLTHLGIWRGVKYFEEFYKDEESSFLIPFQDSSTEYFENIRSLRVSRVSLNKTQWYELGNKLKDDFKGSYLYNTEAVKSHLPGRIAKIQMLIDTAFNVPSPLKKPMQCVDLSRHALLRTFSQQIPEKASSSKGEKM